MMEAVSRIAFKSFQVSGARDPNYLGNLIANLADDLGAALLDTVEPVGGLALLKQVRAGGITSRGPLQYVAGLYVLERAPVSRRTTIAQARWAAGVHFIGKHANLPRRSRTTRASSTEEYDQISLRKLFQ